MLAGVCSRAYISVNRCQSSLQKTIGAPMQACDAAMMQASLTVTTERLHAFEEKINSKLDALTAVECSPILSAEKGHRIHSARSFYKPKTSYRNRSKSSFRTPKPSRAESSSCSRHSTHSLNPYRSISTLRAALSWRRYKAASVGASTTVQAHRSHPRCLPAVRHRRTP